MIAPDGEVVDHVDAALESVDAERRASETEIEAWQRFRDQVRELMADSSHPPPKRVGTAPATTGPVVHATTAGWGSKRDLRPRLREAYRETVMAVPTADELESSARDHMAAEFGGDVASVVFAQTGPPPDVLAFLEGPIASAIAARQEVVQQCDDETVALEACRGCLESVREQFEIYRSIYPSVSFAGLVAYDDHLAELAGSCERLARRRQEQLHRELTPGYYFHNFTGYVYRNSETPLPVLSAIADLLGDIRDLRQKIASDVATR